MLARQTLLLPDSLHQPLICGWVFSKVESQEVFDCRHEPPMPSCPLFAKYQFSVDKLNAILFGIH
jgi:hypothetical protein